MKLVNFEINRFAKLFTVLLGIILLVQIAGVIILSKMYVNLANEKIYEDMMSKAAFLSRRGPMSFSDIVGSVWFLGPIALCIAAIAFYIFFIWYRDWFGKNTFIYRLLMLPTARLNVFFAKATTILLTTFGFVAFQLILLPIETTIFKWMVPNEFRVDLGIQDIIGSLPELLVIIPNSFVEFFLYYGAGFVIVSIMFTAILFERSYRWKGVLIGVLYSLVAVVVFIIPMILQSFVLNEFFYPIELLAIEVVMAAIILACSIWTSGYLLKKKVTV
ncbi:hypothetical protein [Virgibacillus phasianinus]|uniref:hypothetical protein n=1 Tax=Virgibacillus phasianinus TaxID=2017483 RepID=UPI0031832627